MGGWGKFQTGGLQGQNRAWVRDDSRRGASWVRVLEKNLGQRQTARGEVAGLEGPTRTWVREDSRRGDSWVTGLE